MNVENSLTFYSTYALDPVTDLHIVTFKRHEDSIGVIGLTLRVDLWIAVLELESIVAVVLYYFTVYFKVFLHPAEGQIDFSTFSPAFETRFVIYQAVDFFVLGPANIPNNRWWLRRLWRVLLAANASIPHLGTWIHQGGTGQEVKGGVTGASVP